MSEGGLEAYFCAHLLTGWRRTKRTPRPWWRSGRTRTAPRPFRGNRATAIVESSPGHAHLFWRLRRPVWPHKAEALNRGLLMCVGADRSGWELALPADGPSPLGFGAPARQSVGRRILR
jgi:hypothetical protein